MAGEWPILQLREAGVTLIDCDHRTPTSALDGYPYVTIPQMKNGEIDFKSARKISAADFVDWTKKARPEVNDILLSRRCNPGETATVRNETQFAVGQNLVLLRADGKHVLPPFLKWLTRSPYWWEQVEKYRNPGAVFESLKCRDIVLFEHPIPPMSVQSAIVEVLGPLDDKIELNRRTAGTLEEIARALFKSWFVDFDPVRAKAEDRPVGVPDEIAVMFPSRLDDNGLPEGWATAQFGDLFEVRGGNTPSTEEPAYWGVEYDWATPRDLSRLNSPVLLTTERQLSVAGLAKSNSGLLPPRSIMLSTRAPIGYLAFATSPVAINQGIAGIVAKKTSTAYAWLWCERNIDMFVSVAGGSTFPEISKGTLRSLPILAPAENVLTAFAGLADDIISRIINLAKENESLKELRDTLLPKLLSGELSIKNAMKAGAAA